MKYPSKYSNGKTVAAAQYITELLCENIARMEKKDLHYRFWTTDYWKNRYKNQIHSAHQLLKKHSAEAICEALKDKRAKNIYSFRAPHLKPIIEEHEKILASKNKTLTQDFDRSEKHIFRANKKKHNIISKLEEIDDGH
jgi:hypothetical protein